MAKEQAKDKEVVLIEKERAKLEKERAKAHADKLESAREMKRDGISNERIARFIKLPVEVVEKL